MYSHVEPIDPSELSFISMQVENHYRDISEWFYGISYGLLRMSSEEESRLNLLLKAEETQLPEKIVIAIKSIDPYGLDFRNSSLEEFEVNSLINFLHEKGEADLANKLFHDFPIQENPVDIEFLREMLENYDAFTLNIENSPGNTMHLLHRLGQAKFHLEKALNWLKENELDLFDDLDKSEKEVQSDIVTQLACFTLALEENVIGEELPLYLGYLMSNGLVRIDKLVKIFPFDKENNEIFEEMRKSALKAEKLFFSLIHNPENGVIELKNQIGLSRRSLLKTTLNIQKMTGRGFITAYKEDLSDIEHIPNNTNTLYEENGWHKVGTKSISGSRVAFKKGYSFFAKKDDQDLENNIQFKPIPSQVGNIFLSGVGRYGDDKKLDILSVINSFTKEEPQKEKLLAKFFMLYKQGNPKVFSKRNLEKGGFYLPQKNQDLRAEMNRLQKIAFLVCYLEESRRNNGEDLPQYPFSAAISCGLMLVADGYLRMRDLLGENAPYGVFTGTGVMTKNIEQTVGKFKSLFGFFLEKYQDLAEISVSELAWDIWEDEDAGVKWCPTTNYYYDLFKRINEPGKMNAISVPHDDLSDEEGNFINIVSS